VKVYSGGSLGLEKAALPVVQEVFEEEFDKWGVTTVGNLAIPMLYASVFFNSLLVNIPAGTGYIDHIPTNCPGTATCLLLMNSQWRWCERQYLRNLPPMAPAPAQYAMAGISESKASGLQAY